MEHAKLHGYFIEKFEQIEREIRDYQFERRPLVETKTNLAKRKQGEEQRKNKAEARLNKLFGQIETSKRIGKNYGKSSLVINKKRFKMYILNGRLDNKN